MLLPHHAASRLSKSLTAEYFLAFTEDGPPLLFNLISQCFQDVGLTE
jgi:hypothetical protein